MNSQDFNFIIVSNRSRNRTSYAMWADIVCQKNVTFLPHAIKTDILSKFRKRLHSSKKLTTFFPFLKRDAIYFEKFYQLSRTLFSPSLKNIVIFEGRSICNFDKSFLHKLKNCQNVTYILVLVDPLAKLDFSISFLTECEIDKVYSFDDADCFKYGFVKVEQIYSKLKYNEKTKKKYDLYFAGRDKGRLDLLYSFLKYETVRIFFRLSDISLRKRIRNASVKYRAMIPYAKIIREISFSNCLLEIVQPGQTGITWRYAEAICYNKKLISNNKNIKNKKFYDPRYMKLINEGDDLSTFLDWIRREETIDYGYDNSYSPKVLLDLIANSLA